MKYRSSFEYKLWSEDEALKDQDNGKCYEEYLINFVLF